MITQRVEHIEGWEELEQLYRDGLAVLAGLDRLGLYQAGAYLSMALEIMRQRHPLLSSYDPETPTSSPPPAP
jgi:hypothetical protein